jgi:hypothetical protein
MICGAAGTPLPYPLRAFPWAFVMICGAAGTPLPYRLRACPVGMRFAYFVGESGVN